MTEPDRARPFAEPIRTRLRRGASAQAGFQLATAVVQVAAVPAFLSVWGAALYGDWVVLFAFPAYLSLADWGLATAAINSTTIAVRAGNQREASAVFQSAFALLTTLSLVVLVVFAAAGFALPVPELLNLTTVSRVECGVVLTLLALQVIGSLHTNLAWGLFAAAGDYGRATRMFAVIALGEFGLAVAAAALGGGLIAAAGGYALARCSGALYMYRRGQRSAAKIRVGWREASRITARTLVRPALASGAFPAGNLLSLQAMTVLTSIVIGPVAAAVFSVTRTLTRVVMQPLRAVVTIIHTEVAGAFAVGDTDLIRRLYRRATNLAMWVATVMVLALVGAGPLIFEVWTGGQLSLNRSLLTILLAVAAVNAIWFTSLVVLYATNRHARAAARYLVISLAAAGCAVPLAVQMGVDGVAVALLGAEVCIAAAVLPLCLRAADDTFSSWLTAVVRPPPLRQYVGLLRREIDERTADTSAHRK